MTKAVTDRLLLLLEKRAEAFPFVLVSPFELGTSGFVVTIDGGERVVRKTLGDEFWRGAEETISRPDVVIEKAERLARIDCLKPKGDAAEFDRHGIEVHAEEAAARDFAESVAVVARANSAIWGGGCGAFFPGTPAGGGARGGAA